MKKPPKLIALHPRIRLEQTNGWQEFQQILVGLAQVCWGTGFVCAGCCGACMKKPETTCLTSRP